MNILISKARENNLKNIDLEISRNKLTVITGVSGSGKSSLAFDTIHAEAYRRYIDTLPLFARQFIKILKKPELDYIHGLSPSIAVEQKGLGSHSRRSTVGTITDISNYLRLLYSKMGVLKCDCGELTQNYKELSAVNIILKNVKLGDMLEIKAPLRIDNLEKTIERFVVEGFTKITINNEVLRLEDIDDEDIFDDLSNVSLNIDLIKIKDNSRPRLLRAIELAYKISESAEIFINKKFFRYFGKKNTCPLCGKQYPVFEPKHFSFNSPYGACPNCHGTGLIEEGICEECNGSRFKKDVLSVFIKAKYNKQDFQTKNIYELQKLSIKKLQIFLENFYKEYKNEITEKIVPTLLKRLSFLQEVGLSYLSLDRLVNTLSGGEYQRVRLATQIGIGLQNVIYVLDEPSIGLHPSDNAKLIKAIKKLRDIGNTVIVVEHDEEMIRNADYIIDLGPGAGRNGGKIQAIGTIDEILKTNTLTAKYLSKRIQIPRSNDTSIAKKFLTIKNVNTHNLKNITVDIPIGQITTVTGLSGSGKSSLIIDTLLPEMKKILDKEKASLELRGVENFDKIIYVNQRPIGRSYRSNPASFVGILAPIRELLAATPRARELGFHTNDFSFNSGSGRCEKCEGGGLEKIELKFMPPVFVKCSVCNGHRFKESVLSVSYKGANIYDILNMTVNEALDFFYNIKKIRIKLSVLQEVGLGYINLGQSSVSLSGGESQRIKLARELSKRGTSKTLYILDEPTTGLHFSDIHNLLDILLKLKEKGATIIVIEHNPEVIKSSDYIVDLGPEGGEDGGYLLYQGPINKMKNITKSKTEAFI